ncbi:hypothetical protein C8F04DRAFT_1388650 [Mycena alexandri]|uniref:F-box domain-containing protein n=1 Tax=Mycena alexandri TaxID=1745969 RepID=A0AAD6XCN5_9AGAR|nr:hypothetical protein C8F04DRAFT_1388650 [Mycena alexandri]
MHDANSADPVLPAELERVIFEFAAWQDPETVLTLVLVAKRVCIWIEPELYHIVQSRKQRLFRMMQSKPSEFLRQHVHHLTISANVEHADVVHILSTCMSVHNLAIWNNTVTLPELIPLICRLTNLQRLSINLFALFGGRAGDSFHLDQFRIPPSEELPFTYLTHLDIFGLLPEQLWPVFRMLPRLTHLSLTDTYFPESINAALSTCPVLQLLIVVWTEPEDSPLPDESEISTDLRVCIVRCLFFEFDWELGARGGRDVWRRGEEAVANKVRERQKGSDVQDAFRILPQTNPAYLLQTANTLS